MGARVLWDAKTVRFEDLKLRRKPAQNELHEFLSRLQMLMGEVVEQVGDIMAEIDALVADVCSAVRNLGRPIHPDRTNIFGDLRSRTLRDDAVLSLRGHVRVALLGAGTSLLGLLFYLHCAVFAP